MSERKRIGDDPFIAATPDDVADGKLVAGHLRALERKVDSGFALITNKLLTKLDRLEEKIDEHGDALKDITARMSRLESDRDADRKRLAAIEEQLSIVRRPRRARK